jgi:excisionase family DNA binding protein
MGDGYLTIEEFAEALKERGLPFHEQTIRAWIKKGRIKAVRPGLRQWYIPKGEVDRVLKEANEGDRQALVAALA